MVESTTEKVADPDPPTGTEPMLAYFFFFYFLCLFFFFFIFYLFFFFFLIFFFLFLFFFLNFFFLLFYTQLLVPIPGTAAAALKLVWRNRLRQHGAVDSFCTTSSS